MRFLIFEGAYGREKAVLERSVGARNVVLAPAFAKGLREVLSFKRGGLGGRSFFSNFLTVADRAFGRRTFTVRRRKPVEIRWVPPLQSPPLFFCLP